jgi:hypothetical protein
MAQFAKHYRIKAAAAGNNKPEIRLQQVLFFKVCAESV